jgi:hypothetical protein
MDAGAHPVVDVVDVNVLTVIPDDCSEFRISVASLDVDVPTSVYALL